MNSLQLKPLQVTPLQLKQLQVEPLTVLPGRAAALAGVLCRASAVVLVGAWVFTACTPDINFLGYNDAPLGMTPPPSTTASRVDAGAGGAESSSLEPSMDSGIAGNNAAGSSATTGGAGGVGGAGAAGGTGGVAGSAGAPATTTLPDHFVDIIGVTPEESRARVLASYDQLFHGDPNTQAIYVEVGTDQAYVHDVFHNDTRLDALGLGLFITVQFNQKTEFDRLWRFTKAHMQYAEGPKQGYFYGTCPTSGEGCADDVGVFGSFYVVTALLLAENQWGNGALELNYGAEAALALDAMLHKETQNSGVVEEVTNLFPASPELPQTDPSLASVGQVAPNSVMPAFFEYWGRQTGEPYWQRAAQRGREYLLQALHPDTGLAPAVTDGTGVVIPGSEIFAEGSYGVAFNLALDTAWYGREPGQIEIANRLIGFFAAFGGSYPAYYLYSGEPQNENPALALVAMNGAVAGIATREEREAFIRVVWDTPTQEGIFRYFDGINQLLALMYLGGILRPL